MFSYLIEADKAKYTYHKYSNLKNHKLKKDQLVKGVCFVLTGSHAINFELKPKVSFGMRRKYESQWVDMSMG